MKTLLYFFFSLLTISVSGQDGINTATPEVTLDIVRKSSVPNHYDWLIPPCITGDQLPEKIYSVPKKQTLLFVTLPAYVLSGQLINVAEPGLYYFDGSLWQPAKQYRSFGFSTEVIPTPPAVGTYVLKVSTEFRAGVHHNNLSKNSLE
jgi:hypothetical protein